ARATAAGAAVAADDAEPSITATVHTSVARRVRVRGAAEVVTRVVADRPAASIPPSHSDACIPATRARAGATRVRVALTEVVVQAAERKPGARTVRHAAWLRSADGAGIVVGRARTGRGVRPGDRRGARSGRFGRPGPER